MKDLTFENFTLLVINFTRIKLLRLLIILFVSLFLLQYSLHAEDSWPSSFKEISYEKTSNSLENIFDSWLAQLYFNRAYNPGGNNNAPIPDEFRENMQIKLIQSLNENYSNAIDKVRNCQELSSLFDKAVKENLPKIPRILCISESIEGDGSINHLGFFMNIKYFKNYIYNYGKQLREIKDGQRSKIDITRDDFNIDQYGDRVGVPIETNMAHELLHHLTGFNGGGLEAECIVHCLTKKCIDPNWDLKGGQYTFLNTRTMTYELKNLECNNISDSQWEKINGYFGKDVGHELNKGNCFCDIKWKIEKDCDEKKPPKKQVVRNMTPDDNYSYFSGAALSSNDVMPSQFFGDFLSLNFYPDILVYNKYDYFEITQLLDKYKLDYISDYVHDYFNNNHKVMVIPSGEWIGEEQSEITREAIRQFVETGGTIIVLSQQYDEHIQGLVPIPEGETLTSYGWRQDQSCYNGSVYFDTIHPVLSSSTSELVTATVDGYFASWPSTANVILNRTKNNDAAILHYPYGNGHVILTSFYTDWGAAHSQASAAELKIFRDLITFAKNPSLPIPMYDLSENQTPQVNLNVNVKNLTESTAVRAKLLAFTPERDSILFESQADITLSTGQETVVPMSFTLPQLETGDYGICHVYYELYDSGNNLIQFPTESASGRFAVYHVETPYTENNQLKVWITSASDTVYISEPLEFTFHIKNNSDQSKTIDLTYSWNHETDFRTIDTVTVAPGETFELDLPVSAPSFTETWDFNGDGSSAMRFWLNYRDTGQNITGRTFKGIVFETSKAGISGLQVSPSEVIVGQPVNYSFEVSNESGMTMENVKVSATLEKLQWPENAFVEVAAVFNSTLSILVGEKLSVSDSYIPQPVLEKGSYRLKLLVEKTDGSKKEEYGYFYFRDSSVWPKTHDLTADNLGIGVSFPVKFNLNKESNYNVTQGAYSIVFRTVDGQEAFRKDVENVSLSDYGTNLFEESIIFNPTVVSSHYRMSIEYRDETMTTSKVMDGGKMYSFQFSGELKPGKPVYNYPETGNIILTIMGSGDFDVHFTCPDLGLDEQRVVSIPQGFSSAQETIAVALPMRLPTGVAYHYNVLAEVTSHAGYSGSNDGKYRTVVSTAPVQFDTQGDYSRVSAVAGEAVDFEFKIKSLSGLAAPLTGRLNVVGLGSDKVGEIALVPGGDSAVSFNIPVSEDIQSGDYKTSVTFSVNGLPLYTGTFPIRVSGPELKFSEPATNLLAGDSFTLTLENIGGKTGNYRYKLWLNDRTGKSILTHTADQEIAAGQNTGITLTIPGDAATGPYILHQEAEETVNGQTSDWFSLHLVNGIELSLNGYTSQDAYLSSDTVTGKAEIDAGGGSLNSSELQARILRHSFAKGLEEETPGTYMDNNFVWIGHSSGTKLYLSTDYWLVEYDKSTGEATLLDEFEYICRALYMSSSGELWAANKYTGVFRRDSQGNMVNYTRLNGLLSDATYDVIEADYLGNPSIWVATSRGVSIFSSGAWTPIDKVNGVSIYDVYRLTKDANGDVWASTYRGVLKFNGSEFEQASTPFGTSRVNADLTATADGSVWMSLSGVLYRYKTHSDEWEQWNLSELTGWSSNSFDIEHLTANNGELWITGRNVQTYRERALIHYSGGFNIYSSKDYQQIYYIWGMASGNGDGEYFVGDIGFFKWNNGVFKLELMDFDKHMLPDQVYSLKTDTMGRLWAGTVYGISMYDGQQWTNYPVLPSGELIGSIKHIDFDKAGNVYGVYTLLEPDGGIIKLVNGNYEVILFPNDPRPYAFTSPFMIVDNLDRIWAGTDYGLWYYDGQWHTFEGITNVDFLQKDGTGGLWVSHLDSTSAHHVTHIKKDLSMEDFTASNSGLLPGKKDRLYLDGEDILWCIGPVSERGNVRILQSFDGTTWKDFSALPGYPPDGPMNLVKDNQNRVFIIDLGGKLYQLENDSFTEIREGISGYYNLAFAYGRLNAAGKINLNYDLIQRTNLFKISFTDGFSQEEMWRRNYPLSMNTGEQKLIDITADNGLPPGLYFFETNVLSSIGQTLAADTHPFCIGGDTLSMFMLTENAFAGAIKKDANLPLTIEIRNNTGEDKTSLALNLTKTSPSGNTGEILSEIIDIPAGQKITRNIMFSETETGVWSLSAQLTDADTGVSGETPARTSATNAVPDSQNALSEFSTLVEVVQPSVAVETLAPDSAGNEPFDFKIRLTSQSSISSTVNVKAGPGGSLLDQSVTLTPGEVRLLSFSDSITSDKTYTVTLSGDVNLSRSYTVTYGYNETLNLNVQPSYREGQASIGYTIANTGGLPFTDTLHFDCFVVGGSTPVYSFERTYNLYPLQPEELPISDNIFLNLPPGNYLLKSYSGKLPSVNETLFNVIPSGIGTVILTGETTTYPVESSGQIIPFSVTNSDTVASTIELSLAINGQQGSVLADYRAYYLQPLQSIEDSISINFPYTGNYTLSITGSKLTAPVTTVLQAAQAVQVEASLAVGTIQNGTLPVNINAENSGFLPFAGTLRLNVTEDGITHEETITVNPGDTINQSVVLDTSLLSPGNKSLTAILVDISGTTVTETTATVTILDAEIHMEIPSNLEVDAGGFTNVPLTLQNQGHQRGSVVLEISALENLDRRWEIQVEPGSEIQLENVIIEAPFDLPSGNYPFHYTLSGSGIPGGAVKGILNVKVNGLTFDVNAALDRSLYSQGETATLTLTITCSGSSTIPLEAVVNWGGFNERRKFTLSTGSSTLNFDIPLDQEREEKIFYGIYHDGGKGIHLNDIYLNFKGVVSVELDKQIYAPGEVIQVVFTSQHSGQLTAVAFGESHTMNLSGSASASFQVPFDTLGGTYAIGWTLEPSAPSLAQLSGSHRLDVSGLVVKAAKARLLSGKYAPGDTITAQFLFESNRSESLDLLTWVTAPSGDWQYLGEIPAAVNAQKQVDITSSSSFSTNEAGTHEYIYGLYKEDQLVVSGRLAFDVGDAVLMGITTQYFEYKQGSETVIVNVDHFGTGSAQLELYLDEEKVQERTVSLNGMSRTQLSLNPSQISGGLHYLRAVITKDSLTSTKSTSFIYGTYLPDLTLSLVGTESQGLDYTYTLSVGNSGQTAAPATSLTFCDNDATLTTLSVPTLLPGAFHQAVVTWTGSGKAGIHEFVFTADSASTVKEFNESNNTLTFTEEIPLLFYSLEVDPTIWPANTPVTILTRLINNQPTPAVLTLNMNITNDDTGQTVFQRNQPETLSAFASKTVSDTFETGVYPAGSYTLSQNISGEGVDLFKDISVYIQATKALSANLTLQPVTVSANAPADVELSMNLENTGNVPLENEILFIEVFNIQSQETVHSEEFLVNLPIAGHSNEIKVLSLTLDEGQYEVRLRYQETQIAMAPLTVIGGIEKEKTLDIRPRVLIMNLHQTGGGNTGSATGLQFIIQLLTAYHVNYDTGMGQSDAMVKLHKGYSNITWMLGNLTGQKELDELSQRVWSGDGLIVVRDKADSSQGWSQFLGVKVKQTSAKKRETQLDLLPSSSPLHPHYQLSGQVTLIKAQDLQLEVTASDVHVVAQTPANQSPVITYRPYGHGHILVLSVPLDFSGGTGEISQLFFNAVNLFSKDVYGGTGSDISRLQPIRLNLTNQTSSSRDVNLEEILPYGVDSYDFDPAPQADPSGEGKLKWTITVPGSSETPLTYWLRLPDQIGGYEIISRFYTGDWATVEEDVPLTFEVTQTMTGRIDELLTSLDTLEVNGSDSGNLRKAKEYLQKIRSRGIDSDMLSHLEKNVEDAAQASVYLSLIQSADVNTQRLAVTYLMRMLARKHYQIAVPQTQ